MSGDCVSPPASFCACCDGKERMMRFSFPFEMILLLV